MKRLLAYLLPLLLLCSACTDDSLHVDLQKELNLHPEGMLVQKDGGLVSGFKTDFCTAVVCFEAPEVDFAALSYTPYLNGSGLIFSLDTELEINTISLSLINKDGEKTHRELPYTLQDDGSFFIEGNFPDEEKEITLNVSVDFTEEGKAQYLFPLELK